jgi:hypothetical protein
MQEILNRVKNNPTAFYRFAIMHKKQGYIFTSVYYFKVNLLDKKGNGLIITVFKGVGQSLSVTAERVKKFTVTNNNN